MHSLNGDWQENIPPQVSAKNVLSGPIEALNLICLSTPSLDSSKYLYERNIVYHRLIFFEVFICFELLSSLFLFQFHHYFCVIIIIILIFHLLIR